VCDICSGKIESILSSPCVDSMIDYLIDHEDRIHPILIIAIKSAQISSIGGLLFGTPRCK